jgi:hypothetical protein
MWRRHWVSLRGVTRGFKPFYFNDEIVPPEAAEGYLTLEKMVFGMKLVGPPGFEPGTNRL